MPYPPEGSLRCIPIYEGMIQPLEGKTYAEKRLSEVKPSNKSDHHNHVQ